VIGARCAPPAGTNPPSDSDLLQPVPPDLAPPSLFVAPIIELADSDPLVEPPLVDEPITGNRQRRLVGTALRTRGRAPVRASARHEPNGGRRGMRVWRVLLAAALCLAAGLPARRPDRRALPRRRQLRRIDVPRAASRATGAVVRQDEIASWQERSSATGAHSRALAVLDSLRARQIAATLGLGEASAAPACLGCHATVVPGGERGPRFQSSDGIGCESCHGPAAGWIATHYTTAGSHAANVAAGMTPLDDPRVRANLCLDCHYGSARGDQFVTHRMMAAGHPRIVFELDLFSALQQHHDEDADYAQRKGRTDSVRLWAVGQAEAVRRQLDLFARPGFGSEGDSSRIHLLRLPQLPPPDRRRPRAAAHVREQSLPADPLRAAAVQRREPDHAFGGRPLCSRRGRPAVRIGEPRVPPGDGRGPRAGANAAAGRLRGRPRRVVGRACRRQRRRFAVIAGDRRPHDEPALHRLHRARRRR
jgi:hypothetical protein